MWQQLPLRTEINFGADYHKYYTKEITGPIPSIYDVTLNKVKKSGNWYRMSVKMIEEYLVMKGLMTLGNRSYQNRSQKRGGKRSFGRNRPTFDIKEKAK